MRALNIFRQSVVHNITALVSFHLTSVSGDTMLELQGLGWWALQKFNGL